MVGDEEAVELAGQPRERLAADAPVMLLAHDIALALGIGVADREVLQARGIEGKKLLEIGARAALARRHGMNVDGRALAGPAVGRGVREEPQRNLLVLRIAPDQQQMLEIMGKAAALAACLVGAACADDHPELGRRAGLVADKEEMLAQALLGGESREWWQQQEREKQHPQREGQLKTLRHPNTPARPIPRQR